MIDIFSLTGGVPQALTNMLGKTDVLLARCKKRLNDHNKEEQYAKRNLNIVPTNATIREERIKCGKLCYMCPHGPYYYAYWKDVSGRLKKKYIGSKFDPSWKNQLTVKNITKQVQKPSKRDF